MQCAVTRGAWGTLVRRESGQGDVAWRGALCSWCMRGCAKQALSQGKSSRTQAATTLQPAISHESCPSFYYPSSSLDFKGLRSREGLTKGVSQTITLQYHLAPTSRPSAPAQRGYTGAYHECGNLSSLDVWH